MIHIQVVDKKVMVLESSNKDTSKYQVAGVRFQFPGEICPWFPPHSSSQTQQLSSKKFQI